MEPVHSHTKAIAKMAYIFAFPLVMSYADAYARVVDGSTPGYSGGFETWRHSRDSLSAGAVQPGDTHYSTAWVDVRAHPRMVMLTPALEEVHTTVRVFDLWGFVLAEWRLPPNRQAEAVLLVPPSWMGEITRGVNRIVRGESAFLRLVVARPLVNAGDPLVPEFVAPAALASQPANGAGASRAPQSHQDWLPCSGTDFVTNRYWSCANAALSLDELTVELPEPLDRALLESFVWVERRGEEVEGEVAIDRRETRWRLRPAAPWREGDYALRVDSTLEDLAGNGVERPFEVEMAIRRTRVERRTLSVGFSVGAGAAAER